MDAAWSFAGASGAVFATVSAILAVLRRPMSPLLAELCGGKARGDAWVALVSVCAVLGATAASMLPDGAIRPDPLANPTASGSGASDALLLGFAIQCVFGLGGVLLSLLVIGSALYMYIRRLSACNEG